MLASYGIESTVKIWCVGGQIKGTEKAKMLFRRDEVIESNLRRVRMPTGSRYGVLCRDCDAFRQRARYLRSPDGCPWRGPPPDANYLPTYVSDYDKPVSEWGKSMIATLQGEKVKGNLNFVKGQLHHASESYLKVLRYIRAWSEDRRKKKKKKGEAGKTLAAVKQVEREEARDLVVGEEEMMLFEESCLLNLAACRLQQKEYKEAWSFADLAIKCRPSNPKAFFRRGCASMEMHDYESAVADLSQVRNTSPLLHCRHSW